MQNITLIGIDLGKHSFHIHCQDKSGKALLRKKDTPRIFCPPATDTAYCIAHRIK
ncbi:TPA: IS110 family transposase, partial [Shigella flexneri]